MRRVLDRLLIGDTAALRATKNDVVHSVLHVAACFDLDLFMLESYVVKLHEHPLAAVRALYTPVFPRACVEGFRDPRPALDGRRRDHDHLPVVEGRGPGFQQGPRITLTAGVSRPAVDLIAEHIPRRDGREVRRAAGSGERQHAAGIFFLQDGVGCLPAGSGSGNFFPKRLCVPDHRRDPSFGEVLGVFGRRRDPHCRAGIDVDLIAQHVELHLSLSDLG